MCRFKFRLWLKATLNSAFGNDGDLLKIVERRVAADNSAFNNAIYLLRTAKRRELHKAIINKSGHGVCGDRLFCGEVPI